MKFKNSILSSIGVLALAFITTSFNSCKPEDIKPVTGKNSQLLLDSITFHQFYMADYLKATSTLEFLVVDSTSDSSMVSLVDSFYLSSPFNYKRSFDFDMPVGAKNCRISFSVFAKNGYADSVSIRNMVFRYDGQVYLNKALSAEDTELNNGSNFIFPTQIIEF